MDDLLTVEQVAERLQIDPETVRRYLREKKIKGVKIGWVWRVRESELNWFIQEGASQEGGKE